MKAINGFFNEFRFLSNFWMSEVVFEGIQYPSVEHAFQAAKSLELTEREWIRKAPTPKEAKHRGYKIYELRSDWEEVKIGIMEELVRQKFTNHSILQEALLLTGDAYLEETNTWNDVFWGVCNEVGENHLGKILMKVREELTNSNN